MSVYMIWGEMIESRHFTSIYSLIKQTRVSSNRQCTAKTSVLMISLKSK